MTENRDTNGGSPEPLIGITVIFYLIFLTVLVIALWFSLWIAGPLPLWIAIVGAAATWAMVYAELKGTFSD